VNTISTNAIATHFMTKVDTKGLDECWPWLGYKKPDGYGLYGFGNQRAHRVSWTIFRWPIPEGMLVLHKCNNRACVNPKHLYIGDHFDNAQDAKRSGSLQGRPTRGGGLFLRDKVRKARRERKITR